jgi:ATP-dependent helicase HrpB
VRLWSPALHRGLPVQDRPEILEAELSGLALDLAAWGTEPAALSFLDPPPAGAMAAARALLRDLDALDAAGAITPTGRRMARLGAHPRLARTMLAAETEGERALAADLAALLEERDPIRGREAPSSIALRLDLLRGQAMRSRPRRPAPHRTAPPPCTAAASACAGNPEPEGDAGALLAAGFPDRIAAKRGVMDGAFRLAGGMGARLPATDPLAKSPLLAVADLDLRGTDARIRMAAPLSRAALEARFPDASSARRAPPSTPAPAPCSPAAASASARWCWKKSRSPPPTPPRSPPPSPRPWPSAACATCPGRTRRGRHRPASAGCGARKATPGPTFPTPS